VRMFASTKRLIWALGFWVAWDISRLVEYLIEARPDFTPEESALRTISFLLIWLVPLFFFKDDKKQSYHDNNQTTLSRRKGTK